jgi:diguanylate cyclase (GGDEF)-like protein
MNKNTLQRAQFLNNLFDAIPSMLFIVDDDVRVVHLNAAAKALNGADMLHSYLKSGGMIMHCIHAAETRSGCGKTASCNGCVIRRVVKEASRGKKIYRQDTKMEVVGENGRRESHISLTASPFVYGTESLVLLIVEDITEQKESEVKLKELNGLLERRATTDMLTGIYNRLRFNEYLEREIGGARRYNHPVSLIMFDIDHFKKINDTYGHHTGDRVLQELAKLVSASIRETDIFARWGGEEFMILSPHTDVEQAALLAEKLRAVIEAHRFDEAVPVTSSFGVTQFVEQDSIEGLTARVDQALYQAKGQGRNRVVAAPVPETAMGAAYLGAAALDLEINARKPSAAGY